MTNPNAKRALLLLSFGGPNKAEEVVPFLENVTRGRGIPRERLEAVGEHYFTLGGASPINKQNLQIIENLRAEIAARGLDWPVYFGNRNWEPFVEDAMVQMARDGVEEVLVFATSAWGGYSGCAQYQEDIARGLAACEQAGVAAPEVVRLPQFHAHPALIAEFAAAVDRAREELAAEVAADAGSDDGIDLVFVAHSVPLSADDAAGPAQLGGNLYSEQVLDAARLVQAASSFAGSIGAGASLGWVGKHEVKDGAKGEEAGAPSVELVWQSRSGAPHIPWLEPDICDHIEARVEAGITRGIVLCPIGFITDHIEVVWDLDTEAKAAAAEAGVPFIRAATPGLTATFARMVVDLAESVADAAFTAGETGNNGSVADPVQALGLGAPVVHDEAQAAAAALAAKLQRCPDLGATRNGVRCAPGCCS